MARRYDRNVKPWEFVTNDLVLQKMVGNMKDQGARKLASNWEVPYRVTTLVGARAYYLEDMEERSFPQPWNVSNLKRYYH